MAESDGRSAAHASGCLCPCLPRLMRGGLFVLFCCCGLSSFLQEGRAERSVAGRWSGGALLHADLGPAGAARKGGGRSRVVCERAVLTLVPSGPIRQAQPTPPFARSASSAHEETSRPLPGPRLRHWCGNDRGYSVSVSVSVSVSWTQLHRPARWTLGTSVACRMPPCERQ